MLIAVKLACCIKQFECSGRVEQRYVRTSLFTSGDLHENIVKQVTFTVSLIIMIFNAPIGKLSRPFCVFLSLVSSPLPEFVCVCARVCMSS